ncbi:MAG TPA: hypothetical protein PL167_07705 [Cyclobacteriaceae bacterium]|nr:hypothetical protein [Cyclobacteriaceae bacterium]
MTKATTKTVAVKKAPAKKTVIKPKTSSIEKVSEEILAKLKALDIEHQLQADIEWCLGSYRFDQNPAGLIESANKALSVFKQELAKKTKGVTATLISGIEKSLK